MGLGRHFELNVVEMHYGLALRHVLSLGHPPLQTQERAHSFAFLIERNVKL